MENVRFIPFNPPKWWKYSAITVPPIGIFIRKEFVDHQQLRRHELAHWKQYQEKGLLLFYAAYLWYSIRHGYRNNPMEVEARTAENTEGW